jgi:hypothetical protein
MKTPRSRRFNKVEFRRKGAATENAAGEPVAGSSTLIAPAWAAIFYGKGAERREAAIEGASQSATFNVDTNAALRSVTVGDFIQFGGSDWDIASINPVDRSAIEFTAVRRTSLIAGT